MTDEELQRQFEECTLPYDQWTHRAHVKVAFLYLRDHPLEVAVNNMRDGIRDFNAANEVPEGPWKGYNETTTVAFLRLIAATMAAYGEVIPTASADAFCDAHPQLMCKHVLRLFYSPAQRGRPEAKHQFVEPDLAPLPKIASARGS